MRTILIVLFISCKSSGSTCRLETDCISLRECAHYTSFLETMEKPLKPSVVNFLRAQECGFSEGYPKVCCTPIPKGLNIFHDKTQTTLLDDKTQTTLFDITVSTAPPMATMLPYQLDKKSKKMHEFNLAFQDFLDFDLYRKRRSQSILNKLGVEIHK